MPVTPPSPAREQIRPIAPKLIELAERWSMATFGNAPACQSATAA
jgi:hypothetical protein